MEPSPWEEGKDWSKLQEASLGHISVFCCELVVDRYKRTAETTLQRRVWRSGSHLVRS